MSRLTNKWKNYYTPKLEAFDKNQDITPLLDKLGKLEDLEEQLGCPLEVVFKALEYGIYAKDLPRDNKGRIIVDITHPHILEDMDYFRPTALHYQKHGCIT